MRLGMALLLSLPSFNSRRDDPTDQDIEALALRVARLDKMLLIGLVLFGATSAAAQNLYGTTMDDLINARDRYAHPRSLQEYRRIVPQIADRYGMCRNAGRLDQCIWRLNGHSYPPPDKFMKAD